MKHILTFILIFASTLLCTQAQDSTQIKKPTIGLHFFYNDFNTAQLIKSGSLSNVLKNKLWNKPQNMEGGFGIDYIQGFNKNIDLIGTFNGSWVDYLLPGNTLYGSSNFLMDIDAGAHFKMLSDRHIFSPFLIAKAEYTKYKNISGFSLAPGAGLQVNLFKEAFVLATIEYRSALSSSISNELYYSIGIATNIGKKKAKPVKVIAPIPVPVIKEIIIPAKDIIIAVTDEATGQPLPYVAVVLSSPDGKKLNGSTDEYGRATFNTVSPADYTVNGLLNNIMSSIKYINKDNFGTNENQISINLTHNDPRFTLAGIVINKTRNLPEGGADVNVTNETNHSDITIQSRVGDGVFRTQLTAGSDFTLVGKKANYISNIEKITTKGLNRSTTLYVKLELGIEEAKIGQSIDLKNIYFETGKATLNTSVSSDLDKLTRFLKDNPEARLEIQGHTDNVGSLALNTKLSQARANSVVEYLTKNEIDISRLIAKGYGPSLPVAENTTPEGKAKNRRVVMKVIQ
jgi:outer membrane protein OmpA-like peptidoglycan-associated protein